jgi:hypothetical protein
MQSEPMSPRHSQTVHRAAPRLLLKSAALALGTLLLTGGMSTPLGAQEPSPPMQTTTTDIAARLVPFPQEERERLLKRIPRNGSTSSQLADSFDGSWYVHRGDLAIDGDFSNNLNLVVDGDLTVRGTLLDTNDTASLVVTGDVRAKHILSECLLVTLGSLDCSGLTCAYYNDWCFEVWGPEMQSRALLIFDRSTTLPEGYKVQFEYNSDSSDSKGSAENLFIEDLVRFVDEDDLPYKRVTSNGKVKWFDEAGEALSAADAKKLRITRTVPAQFEDLLPAVLQKGDGVFKSPSATPLDWRLDPQAPADTLAKHARSKDAKVRAAAASHPQLPVGDVKRLAKDDDAGVRMAVVHQDKLTAAEAATLVKDKNPDVRRQIAASKHAQAHLDVLITDASPEVRRACGSHAGLTDDQRRKLLKDEVKAVRARALRYLPVTAAWVKELRAAEDEALAAWAIEHEKEVGGSAAASSTAGANGDWKKDLMDARAAVRVAALRSPGYSLLMPFLDENRDRFVRDESPDMRRALAMATRDGKTLEALSKDADKYVRRFAIDNLAVPESVLIAEATRLAKAPASSWNTSDPAYIDHTSDLSPLMEHPRLPAEALRILVKVYPRAWRLEPVRTMPLDVILQRAESDAPSVAYTPEFESWKQVAKDPKADQGKVFARMLKMDDNTIQSTARMNAATPIVDLLAHAKTLQDDKYSLEDIAKNPQLKSDSAAAKELRELLLKSDVISTLAKNPGLPVDVLKKIAPESPEYAAVTLWQAHGVALEGVPPRE